MHHKPVSSQQALETAMCYLGEQQYRGRLEILDGLPEQHCLYIAGEMKDCWSVVVPEPDDCRIID